MKRDVDLRLVSQVFFILVIAAIAGYMFYAMIAIGNRNPEKQAQKIQEVIDKALVQCYALEGSFPSDVYYLQKYGVIFEDDKYHYVYDIFSVNFIPQVTVVPKF